MICTPAAARQTSPLRARGLRPNSFVVDSVRPDQGADIYMPDLFEPASHFAVTAAWIAGAVTLPGLSERDCCSTAQRLRAVAGRSAGRSPRRGGPSSSD